MKITRHGEQRQRGKSRIRDDALRLLAQLKRRKQVSYVPAGSFVIAYMGLSEYEQAFTWLELAYPEHSAIMQWVKVHPLFDPIRNDLVLLIWFVASGCNDRNPGNAT